VVPSRSENVVRRPAPFTPVAEAPDVAVGRAAPIVIEQQPPVGRLAAIGRSFIEQGLPQRVVDLLLSGNRPATISAYDSGWRNWCDWFPRQRRENPLSASLTNVLDFLTELHLAKKSYSCINSHRSMLSKSLPHIDGRPVGITHPHVMTLLKACYNLNPPRPKYNSTWNPDVVLSYIMGLGDNPSLSLAVLSQKVVVLIALAGFLAGFGLGFFRSLFSHF